MSGAAIKIGKKVLRRKKHEKQENPNSANILYEWVRVPDRNGDLSKKTKKQEREYRPEKLGISKNDAEILRKVRKKAYRYDQSFDCCCGNIKFGWSAIIGLFPVVGDIIEVLMALSLIRTASKIDGGFGWLMWFKMVGNIALDFGLGFVPVAGDLVDFFYRANTRNAWILDDHLLSKANPQGADDGTTGDWDVERGDEQAEMVQTAPAPPAAVPPAQTRASRPEMAPQSRSGPPGRSLTGQGNSRDPRDRGAGGRRGRR